MSSSTQALSSGKNTIWSVSFWNRVHRYRCLMSKYWWLLVLTLSAAIFTTAWYQMTRPLRYGSNAEMHVSLVNPSLRFDTAQDATNINKQDLDDFMAAERDTIMSHAVGQMAADKTQARYPDMPRTDHQVSVVVRGPKLLISATGLHAAYVQGYLQSVIESYLEFRKKQRVSVDGEAAERVATRIPEMKAAVDEDDADIIKFQKDHNTVFSTEKGKGAPGVLAALQTKLGTLTDEYNRLSLMTPDQGLGHPVGSANANGASAQDGGMYTSPAESDYRQAQDTIVRLQTQADDLGRDLRPKHPKMIALRSQIEQQNKLIASLLEQNRKRIQNQRELVSTEIDATKEQIKDAEPKAQANALLQMEFDKLQEKKDRDAKMLAVTNEEIGKAALSTTANVDPIRIDEMPSPAAEVPSAWLKLMTLALAVGLGTGIGILLIIDRMDDRMNSISDFQAHFDEHVIGQIPRDTSPDQTSLLRPDDQRHQLVESFRNLRSTLLYMPLDGARPKTLLITSAIPNEGKSTLSSNLALVMAFAGMKTLLIDGDLRRGEIHGAFGVTREPGFTDVLAHNVNWKIAIRATGIENLHVLPRGRNVPQPSEYMLSKATDKLLQELYPLYDYIIIDSSPVLAADDTASLAPKIDATLFVVRLGFTPAKMTRKSLEILQKRQANIPGLILNQVDTRSPEFVYYQYSEYYHAATPEEKATLKAEEASKPVIEVG